MRAPCKHILRRFWPPFETFTLTLRTLLASSELSKNKILHWKTWDTITLVRLKHKNCEPKHINVLNALLISIVNWSQHVLKNWAHVHDTWHSDTLLSKRKTKSIVWQHGKMAALISKNFKSFQILKTCICTRSVAMISYVVILQKT